MTERSIVFHDSSTELSAIELQRRRLLRLVVATLLATLAAVGLALAVAVPARGAATGAAHTAAVPAAGEIAFTRHVRGTGRGDVFVVRADGTQLRRLTRDGSSSDATFSPDGRRIAFVTGRIYGAAAPELYVMDTDGRNARRLTQSQRGLRTFWRNTAPAWSPDGRTIVFVRTWVGRGRETTDLWRVAADGQTRPVRLTKHPGREANPTFAPDGSLAFDRDGWIRRLTPQLGVVDVRPGANPAWAPDGSYLAYQQEDGIHLTLGQGERLRVPGGGAPAWAPDASAFVHVSAEGGLEITSVRGLDTVRVTSGSARTEDLSPSWRS